MIYLDTMNKEDKQILSYCILSFVIYILSIIFFSSLYVGARMYTTDGVRLAAERLSSTHCSRRSIITESNGQEIRTEGTADACSRPK